MESAKPALLLLAGTREPLTQGRPLLLGTTDESQGLGGEFRNEFRAADRSRVTSSEPQSAFVALVSARHGSSGLNSAAFWVRDVAAGAGRRLVEGPVGR
jgi:hypothetical protein